MSLNKIGNNFNLGIQVGNSEEIEKKKARRRTELLLEYNDKFIAPNLEEKILRDSVDEVNKIFNSGKFFYDGHAMHTPSMFGEVILENLPDSVKEQVVGHGVRGLNTEPVSALVNILVTGELKGDWGALKRNDNRGGTLTDADFVLLSNLGEDLTVNGQLSGLRTIMVGGKYMNTVDSFRKAFPGISFRAPQEISEKIFNRKEEKFKSVKEQIEEAIKKEFGE